MSNPFFNFPIYQFSEEEKTSFSPSVDSVKEYKVIVLSSNSSSTSFNHKVSQILSAIGASDTEFFHCNVEDLNIVLNQSHPKARSNKVIVFSHNHAHFAEHKWEYNGIYSFKSNSVFVAKDIQVFIDEEARGEKTERLALWRSLKTWKIK